MKNVFLAVREARGQSMLEYTLMIAAVIGVIIIVMFRYGGIKQQVEVSYDKAGAAIVNSVDNLANSAFTK